MPPLSPSTPANDRGATPFAIARRWSQLDSNSSGWAEDGRPAIPNDIQVSFADSDGEACFAAHSRRSRCRAPRRRDSGT